MIEALVITFFICLLIGMPMAFAMGISSLVALLVAGDLSLLVLPQRFFSGIDSFPLMAIPLFILAADLMTAGRLTDLMLHFSNSLVGHVRGGFGYVNIMSAVLLSGITGSALADAAALGKTIMPMMSRAGYPSSYAAALTAAATTVGPIIPPSILMVVYAISVTGVSVGALFVAGIVPGLMIGLMLAGMNFYFSRRHGYQMEGATFSWRAVLSTFVKAIPALMMPLIIIGGILAGIFTATEAAAVACIYALVVGFLTRKLTMKMLPRIFVASAVVTSSVLLIVSMASAFSWLLTVGQVPQTLAAWIGGVTDSRVVVLILINILVLLVGLFVDTLPAVIILAPVLTPLAAQFGIDPLHFAMILVLNLTIGMITPPVGPILFVVTAVGRLRFETLSRAALPFVAAEIVLLLLITYVPWFSVALPQALNLTR